MGKPASNAELQKQEKLIARYEKIKADLGEQTRQNNKSLATAIIKLRCMVTGEDAELFSGDPDEDEDDEE